MLHFNVASFKFVLVLTSLISLFWYSTVLFVKMTNVWQYSVRFWMAKWDKRDIILKQLSLRLTKLSFKSTSGVCNLWGLIA